MAKRRANGDGGIFYDASRKRFRGQVTIGYDEKGKQKRKSVSGKTKTEVKEKIKQLEFGIRSGKFVDKSSITIYNLAKQMIEDKYDFNEINENTYYTHLATLKRLKPIYNTPLQQANDTQIKAYFQERLDKSNSTLRKDYELLNSSFVEAIRRKIINSNPMESIKLPKSRQVQEKVRAFTIDEQAKLLDILTNEDLPYSSQMLLSMFTGMRMGEINALTKNDINLTFGTITVSKTVSRDAKGQAILGNTTKTLAGKRIIYVTDDVKEILKECLQVAEDDLLFVTCNGKLITSNQVNMQLSRILEKYDILDASISGKVSCHSLRHTYATRMIEGGMQPKVLQMLLGHTDIKVTLNTYCDAFDRFQSENIELTAEYLKQKGLTIGIKNNGPEAVKDGVKIG